MWKNSFYIVSFYYVEKYYNIFCLADFVFCGEEAVFIFQNKNSV